MIGGAKPGGVCYCGRMAERTLIPFWSRLWMAMVCFFRITFRADFAAVIAPAYRALASSHPAPPAPSTPSKAALQMLALLQREGRFLDFLNEEITHFSDAEVGAAARVVHQGCRKTLSEYVTLEPVMRDGEGASISVPTGFDAERIRLTGHVSGNPPYQGILKHHGWLAASVSMPSISDALDPKVLAPAEVELAA